MQVLCIVLMKLLIKRQKQKHKTTKQTASVEGGQRLHARPQVDQGIVPCSFLFYSILYYHHELAGLFDMQQYVLKETDF